MADGRGAGRATGIFGPQVSQEIPSWTFYGVVFAPKDFGFARALRPECGLRVAQRQRRAMVCLLDHMTSESVAG